MSTRPYVVEYPIGEHVWYWTSARYPTAFMAKQAWERVERKVPRGSLGIYRHGPEDEPGVLVSAVSLDDADQVARVAGLLGLGEHEPLSDQIVEALIVRRADVVVSASARGQHSGRLKWRRPDGSGARLEPDGTMVEPEPGQG